MRISGEQLRAAAAEKSVRPADLARAVERPGFQGERAVSAVRNWMRGSDHPRCRHEDIGKLAQALGCEVGRIARFTSVMKYHRGSPRKVALLTDLVRGKDVDTALNLLTFTTKRAAVDVKKALSAAIADAEQANADVTALVVADSRVDDGPRLKRFQPKDRGRSHRILKRLAHITIALQEKH